MPKRYWISITFCAALAAVPLLAQTSAKRSHAADSDMLAWETYKLTMPKVDEWAVANRKVGEYMKAHPEFNNKKKDIGDAKSFAEMEKRIRAEAPGAIEAVESSGLSFREYWNMSVALTMAYVAAQYEKPGMPPPQGVLPENIAFVKANQQKIAKMFADYEKWNGKGK